MAEPEPLPDWLVGDAEAYEMCARSRGENGYIRLESIAAYCDLLDIADLDERRRLMRVLLTVDARVVAHHRSAERKRREGGGG